MSVTFIAKARKLPPRKGHGELVGAWTDGLMISSEHQPGWFAAMRLHPGRTYRVTVEEVSEDVKGRSE